MNGTTWNKLIDWREAQDELDDARYWWKKAKEAEIMCSDRYAAAYAAVLQLSKEVDVNAS